MQSGASSPRLLRGHLGCGMSRGQSNGDAKGLAQTLGQAVNREDNRYLAAWVCRGGAEFPKDSRCGHRGLPEPMWAGEGGALMSAQEGKQGDAPTGLRG